MVSFFSIFRSPKAPIPEVNRTDFFRGDKEYEAEVKQAQELAQLRELKRVKLISSKFEEIISQTSPEFLSTLSKKLTESQKKAADEAMKKATSFADRVFTLENEFSEAKNLNPLQALQKKVKQFLRILKAKKELAHLKKRAVNRKKLTSAMPQVQNWLAAGVLEQDSYSGRMKLGSNPEARFAPEFDSYSPEDSFDRPVNIFSNGDSFEKEYQARHTLEERVKRADQLLEARPAQKTLEQMLQGAQTRSKVIKTKVEKREQRIQALVNQNPFFNAARESVDLLVQGEQLEVSKPSFKLLDEVDAAFAQLDNEF